MPNRSEFIHLHRIDLDAPHIAWGDCWSLLDDAEKSRASQFRSNALKRRWTVARAGLRSILASHCCCSPDIIEFTSGVFGKPELAGAIANTGVTFNLSHSGNMAVVVVAREIDLGIDIEFKKPVSDWASVARRFFSANENARLMNLEQFSRLDAFFDCWTRKEAVIKATGEGMSARLDEFEVSLTPGVTTDVIADISDEQKYIGWRLANVDLGRMFAGAVAARAHANPEYRDHGAWRFTNA